MSIEFANIEVTKVIIDNFAVVKAVDEGIVKSLREAGGYLRKSMMNSIKAAPYGNHAGYGQPMFDHMGAAARIAHRKLRKAGIKVKAASGWALGIRYILFAVDVTRQEMVVGFMGAAIHGSRTVPDVLEHGGVGTRWDGRTFVMRPRPVAEPALQRALTTESDRFRNLWADSVKA